MITYEVRVCIGQDNPEKRIAVKCHDTGVNLMVYLQVCRPGKWRDETEPYWIPAGSTAVIKVAKPDKTYCICDGELVSGGILFRMKPEAFTAAGVSHAEVSLFGADTRRLTSATFDIHVPAECVCEGEKESESYVDVMGKQIQAAIDAAETATDAADKATAAAAHQPTISDAGTWLVWDIEQGEYVDTGVAAQGGGGADTSLGLTGAAVGQIIKVKSVGASGKPTAWEAADMPSGSARLSVTQTETGAVITATDANGTTSATVSNGADGHTPVMTASKSGKVTTIKADGAAIAEIHDGADGSSGGGSAETWELIASGEMSEAATLTVNKDANGNAFALKSCTILVSGALSGGRGGYVRFAVTASGATYFVETSLASENMNTDAKFTFRQGDVPTLAMCSKPGTAWQSGECKVQMALRASDNALAAAQGAVSSFRIGPWSGVAKLGAGCKYSLWGVRA